MEIRLQFQPLPLPQWSGVFGVLEVTLDRGRFCGIVAA